MVIGLIPPLKFEILNAFARGQYTYARVSNFVTFFCLNFSSRKEWEECLNVENL